MCLFGAPRRHFGLLGGCRVADRRLVLEGQMGEVEQILDHQFIGALDVVDRALGALQQAQSVCLQAPALAD